MKSKTYFILLLSLIFLLTSCNKNDNKESTDDLKKKELELKEKELQLKEKELLDKKESELKEKEKQIEHKTQTKNKVDLSGSYWGSIKDGTRWYVFISGFDGYSFKGYNTVYWKTTPDGFKTNFTGTYDSQTGQVIMLEDRNAKGSGKFTGTVSDNGNSMHGDWYRYTDNGSFTWNLKKTGEEGQ